MIRIGRVRIKGSWAWLDVPDPSLRMTLVTENGKEALAFFRIDRTRLCWWVRVIIR